MSDKDELGAFLLGFLVGGLAGAVTALLLAPQSGEDTRAYLKDKTFELRDKTTQSLEEAYAKAEAAAGEAKIRFDEVAKMAQARAEELKTRGQSMFEQIKKPHSTNPIAEIETPVES